MGKAIFFPDPWSSPTILCHPLQLFSLVGLLLHPSGAELLLLRQTIECRRSD